MSTEYQQVPSQQAFYSAQSTGLDPWLISATSNMTISWGGKGAKREYISPPVYDDDMRWSPPSTPTYKLTKKPVPSQYISTLSSEDAWAVVHDNDQDDTHTEDSSQDDEVPNQNLYKTELCRSFEESGTCRYGTKCQFAHGKSELRAVLRHPKYKTEICKTFHTLGTCPYGTRCRFIHTKPKVSGPFASQSVPSSPTYHSPSYASPYASPYTSPPSRISKTSPSSPASIVPSNSKWSNAWPTPIKKFALEEEEDEEDNDDGEVPEAPHATESAPASPTSTPKKRLAIFRNIVN